MAAAVGNQYAAKAKQWSLAIERAVAAWPNEPKGEFSEYLKGLNTLAHEFVKKMHADKDIAFFREFGDRLDGKPAQTIGGDPDAPLSFIGKIERTIVANTKA